MNPKKVIKKYAGDKVKCSEVLEKNPIFEKTMDMLVYDYTVSGFSKKTLSSVRINKGKISRLTGEMYKIFEYMVENEKDSVKCVATFGEGGVKWIIGDAECDDCEVFEFTFDDIINFAISMYFGFWYSAATVLIKARI